MSGVEDLWVKNPPSRAAAKALTASNAEVCEHGRAPCLARCGVHRSVRHRMTNKERVYVFTWAAIPEEKRRMWLDHYLAIQPEDIEAAKTKLLRRSQIDKRTRKIGGRHCRFWQRRVMDGGYGETRFEGHFWLAHRLSYTVFADAVLENQVNHQCDNRACVEPAHLRQGTQYSNIRECIDRSRVSKGQEHSAVCRSPKGTDHGCVKMTEAQVRSIRREYAEGGITQKDLGAKYNISQPQVSSIVIRKTWKHI